MKLLSEVLITTKPIAEQLTKSSDISSMQVHGSTTEDGKITTQSKPLNQSKSEEAAKQKKQQSGECSEQKTPISNCLESKKKLTLLVKCCFEALNTYGGGNDALEASTMLMQMTLGRFDYDTVRKAFEVYLQQSSDMPKPADIVKIIEPPKEKRKWCGATYIQLCKRKRESQFMLDRELQYIKDFENARITGEEEAELVNDAMRQVEQQNKQYWLEN